MRFMAQRAFPLSEDGVQIRQVAVGELLEIPDQLVAGLHAEGFIGDPPADPSASTAVTAPDPDDAPDLPDAAPAARPRRRAG